MAMLRKIYNQKTICVRLDEWFINSYKTNSVTFSHLCHN